MEPYENIPLVQINSDDETFRLSLQRKDERFSRSVAAFGVREPVILLQGQPFTIISGHNRVVAARAAGYESVSAIILQSYSAMDMVHMASMRFTQGRIGPLGRLKVLIRLLDEQGEEPLLHACRLLEVPVNLVKKVRESRLLDSNDGFQSELDNREVPMKTLEVLVDLPEDYLTGLAVNFSGQPFTQGMIKRIVDLMDDCARMGIKAGEIFSAPGPVSDEDVLDHCFRIRYPRFTEKSTRAGDLAKRLSSQGVAVNVPRWLQEDGVTISFRVKKKDGASGFMEKAGSIDLQVLDQLLELL